MKVSVFTLGCKVNRSESDSIMKKLSQMGYEVTDELEYADLYIVNTCAVTSEAEKKSRQVSARISAINRNARVIFTGCATQNSPESFINKENTQLVTGTFKKGKIPELLSEYGVKIADQNNVFEELLPAESLRTRTYVKIQDGCNNFCSYCIIPYLRGRSRSRSPESIIEEILNTKPLECVLNGINISDYHYYSDDLTSLIEKLAVVDTRIRLGSLEVGVINDRLLTALKNLKDFAPQFHLSLQSGSDEVLKKMNRHYTTADYLDRVNLIRKYFPNAGITTDIIVGFPTETEDNFSESLAFTEKVGFSDIHPFPYSKRTGTVASKLTDLDKSVKKERLKKMLDKKGICRDKFHNLQIGKTLSVLIETIEDGYAVGYSENYVRVYLDGKIASREKFYSVTVTSLFKDGVTGVINK